MVVYPKMIRRHIEDELPFMMTENILMEAVKQGGDRQELHEAIRVHSIAAGQKVKGEGLDNDLLDRIAADPDFALDRDQLNQLARPELYVGRAPEQVGEFLEEQVDPILLRFPAEVQADEIRV